jgi:hypothetical protein
MQLHLTIYCGRVLYRVVVENVRLFVVQNRGYLTYVYDPSNVSTSYTRGKIFSSKISDFVSMRLEQDEIKAVRHAVSQHSEETRNVTLHM